MQPVIKAHCKVIVRYDNWMYIKQLMTTSHSKLNALGTLSVSTTVCIQIARNYLVSTNLQDVHLPGDVQQPTGSITTRSQRQTPAAASVSDGGGLSAAR